MNITDSFRIHLKQRCGSFFRGVELKCEKSKYFWEVNGIRFELEDEILAGIQNFKNEHMNLVEKFDRKT